MNRRLLLLRNQYSFFAKEIFIISIILGYHYNSSLIGVSAFGVGFVLLYIPYIKYLLVSFVSLIYGFMVFIFFNSNKESYDASLIIAFIVFLLLIKVNIGAMRYASEDQD